MADREEGYWWTLFDGDWIVAEWHDGRWYSVGSKLAFSDREVTEIGSRIEHKEG
jgi:hypothetical protein